MRIFLILLTALTALAEPPPASVRDHCGAFDVVLRSASGDAMEDDMSVTLAFGTEETKVALPPALYTRRGTLPNVKNLCTQLTALDAGDGRALLLLSRNNRPSFDKLDAVLIDIAKRRVLDVRRDLGELKGETLFVARPANGGFELRVIREYLHACDCAEDAIEDWLRLGVKDGKVTAKWTR